MTIPQIGVVIPVYNEEVLLRQLHGELTSALAAAPFAWSVTYVDDGSRDRSLELLQALMAEDPDHVAIVQLSRNWGHAQAIAAGLSVARGDALVVMDADLQDPPSLIPALVDRWQSGAHVVHAVRRSRQERGLRGLLLRGFHAIINWLIDVPITANVGVFGLMDRRVVAELNKLPERNRYLPALRDWVGFDHAQVEYDRGGRAAGEQKQTFGRLFKYGADAIFAFSYKPLRVSMLVGALASAGGLLAALIIIAMRFTHTGIFSDQVVLGFTTLFSTVVFFSGMQLLSIGVLGEYIGRTYDEAKSRPYFVIRKVWSAS